MKKIAISALTCAMIGSLTLFAGGFSEAISTGKVDGDLRLRYEGVDQAGFTKDASAQTVRLRLGYTTALYNNFQFHVDLETIQKLLDEDFNSTNNGNTAYPVVADPIGSELNQAYVTFSGLKNSLFKLGRQRIILDNARFVGNVGWRQNEQTYDAFTFVFAGVEKGALTLTNIQRVNRVFGAYNANELLAHFDTNAWIVHYSHPFSFGNLSTYGHLIEMQNPSMVASSHQNLGIRFAGKKNHLLYALEYAKQSDFADGSSAIDADYLLAELGGEIGKVTLKAGYEVLGGDGVYGFATPLATLHAFNGWADKFLNTPVNGLQDLYLSVATKFQPGKYPVLFSAFFHKFQADEGSMDYGTEIDALLKTVISKKTSVLLKYADYNANEFLSDTSKIWLMGEYKF